MFVYLPIGIIVICSHCQTRPNRCPNHVLHLLKQPLIYLDDVTWESFVFFLITKRGKGETEYG